MTCSHTNKYTTGFGKITYDYCPDCKEEVVELDEKQRNELAIKEAFNLAKASELAMGEHKGLLARTKKPVHNYCEDMVDNIDKAVSIDVSEGNIKILRFNSAPISYGSSPVVNLMEGLKELETQAKSLQGVTGLAKFENEYYPPHKAVADAPVEGWSHITDSHLNYLIDATTILEQLVNLSPNPEYPYVRGSKAMEFNNLLRKYVLIKRKK